LIFFVAPLFAGFSIWRLWVAGGAHQVQLRAEGFASRVGFGKVRYKGWGRDDEVDLRRVQPGRCVFVIRRLFRVMVTVELRCSDEEAEELRGRISALIGRRVGLEK
jgi:hypothetical protein